MLTHFKFNMATETREEKPFVVLKNCDDHGNDAKGYQCARENPAGCQFRREAKTIIDQAAECIPGAAITDNGAKLIYAIHGDARDFRNKYFADLSQGQCQQAKDQCWPVAAVG